MPIQILMPALSPTMEEGKLAKWLVKEGQPVRAGDIIAEIETDKATMEVEAVDEGTLGRILIPEGTDKVKVNTPIAVLLGEGEKADAAASQTATVRRKQTCRRAAQAAAPAAASRTAGQAPPRRCRCQRVPPRTEAGARAATRQCQAATNGHGEARMFVSPLARRLAKESNIDLAALQGLGPAWPHHQARHRGCTEEWRAARSRRPLQPGTAIAAAPSAATMPAVQAMADDKVLALYEKGSYEVVPHDGMRRIIAQRLTQSKQTIPHFYMTRRLPARQSAGRARAHQRRRAEGGPARLQAVGQRLRHQGAGAGAAAGAGRQRHVDRGRHAAAPPFRRRRRGRGRGRPVHAGHPSCRAQDARRDLQRDEGPGRSAPASAGWPRTSIRAARPRSPTSACTASRASMPSSTRRTPPSWPSVPARSARWSSATASRWRRS